MRAACRPSLLRQAVACRLSQSGCRRSPCVPAARLGGNRQCSTVQNASQRWCSRLDHARRRSLCIAASAADLPEAAEGEPNEVEERAPLLPTGQLDIRVGRIVEVEKHPDADSLYVEKVEVGEEQPRTIISGLVKFVSQEELLGRSVVVLANLKPRNMRGVKSHGMLLCASNDAHDVVELLRVPEGAEPGERIWFGEADPRQADAESPNKIQKKKIWEELQPELKTDDSKTANFKGHTMMTSAGAVTADNLAGANIS